MQLIFSGKFCYVKGEHQEQNVEIAHHVIFKTLGTVKLLLMIIKICFFFGFLFHSRWYKESTQNKKVNYGTDY